MEKGTYIDNTSTYNLLDYSRSHSQLLYRKRVEQINTDIIFKSVQSIVMPVSFVGLAIERVTSAAELTELRENFYFTVELGYRIYKITAGDGKFYYLNAGVFGVYKNKLDILESSLGDFTFSSGNELIFWSEQ